jgi:chemotaxis protein methyltransferase CheR
MHGDALSTSRWHQLSELIAARTGLHFPPERRADLHRALGEAAPEFGCPDSEACADRLLSAPWSTEELRKLARHLTIGETYFFRERPSFNALAAQVLPVLIHQRRQGERRLRLWSAACSTGEEAYSLAMLVQQVLPDWRDWNVSILATDLNPHFLRKAEAGVYGEWSFRDCNDDLRERFFSPVGDRRYRVRADVRDMVTFTELNLAQDSFPSVINGTHAMDLILCRNLLIYFTPAHARRLIGNLRQALVDDGWLIVSPSECSQALFTGFAPVNFPGSILYRKRGAQDVNAPAPEMTTPAPLTEIEVSQVLAPLPAPGPPAAPAPEIAVVMPATEHERLRALGLQARALANRGALAEALAASQRWIAGDKLDAAAHYLHAMVLQELGDRAGARAALQCAVYLQPEFTLAHFALGNHARAEARVAEARRHFANAAHQLRNLAPDELVPESEGLTAGRLREIITALGSDS